jgi:AbrB family looped-hinge helix DNA binding protein
MGREEGVMPQPVAHNQVTSDEKVLCIYAFVYPPMATVKLQRIGNSIRATIPKEIVDDLSLKEGEDVIVTEVDETILIKRKNKAGTMSNTPSQFFGILKSKTGKVQHWPSPEEIKSIWD